MIEPEETALRPPPRPSSEVTETLTAPDSAAQLVHVLDRYLADLQAGLAPDRAGVLAAHPELASRLESCLAGIDFVHRAAGPAAGLAQLGDFRIVREVGRGGMGVVYEAEQMSLRRKVALKVLRFGVVADEHAMRRFRREAETVARLHHTHIVPIFAVGEHGGVHHYAMQFIEGRSLADTLAESQRAGQPIPPADVARWGLQASEALEYAHRRGVIHRDIKPSNLLLDPDGVVWLTDFGLAKQADEATLTLSGSILGTPRYMSPEQAAAVQRPIDHRTDIYSLGATLYELATGRPLFDAQTTHGLITQILNSEPDAPRQVRPGLPRDLETIIQKCLAKEPDRRYPTVAALGEDLRSFLDGRAIKARRSSPGERAARWARKQRRSAIVAGVAATVSVLLVVAAIVAWTAYDRSQLGSVVLTTDDPELGAEVLDDEDDAIVTPCFSLPTRQPVSLAAGSYRVRLSAPGLLDESYQLKIDRSTERRYQVGLAQQRLWEPFPLGFNGSLEVRDLAGRPDLIVVSNQSVSRLEGASGRPIWKLILSDFGADSYRFLQSNAPPGLVQPAPDLDGDGIGDLVWASRTSASLWAISGRGAEGKGKELWRFGGGDGTVVGVPVLADGDGDETPDLIATLASGPNAWVEAVSGRSGRSLWRHPLGSETVGTPPSHSYPAQVVSFGGRATVAIVVDNQLVGLDARRGQVMWPALDLGISPVRSPQFTDLDGDGSPEILVLGGTQPQLMKALALATRRALWEKPVRVGFGTSNGPYVPGDEWPLAVDLDGDGKVEVIVPTEGPGTPWGWAGIEVLDGAAGRVRWRHRVRSHPFARMARFSAGPDINGDGARELFVASIATDTEGRTQDASLFVDALSGKDGHSFWWWRQPLSSLHDQVGTLGWWSEGGADGWPQLIVPVLKWPSEPEAIRFLSAGTGRLTHTVPGAFDPQLADLDGDSISDLVFRIGGGSEVIFGGGKVHAVKGTLPDAWRRLGVWKPARDFNGDGITDLIEVHDEELTAVSGRDGRLLWHSTAGTETGLVSWSRALSTSSSPVSAANVTIALPPRGDLDGDGTADVLAFLPGGLIRSNVVGAPVVVPLQAISGATGRRLWHAPDFPRPRLPNPPLAWLRPPECRDLDGDGRPEVIVAILLNESAGSTSVHQLWLGVLSGRDGRWIWTQRLAEKRMGSPSATLFEYRFQPACVDLDRDGVLDIALGVPTIGPGGKITSVLEAFSGRDGGPLWRQPLAIREWDSPERGAGQPVVVAGDLEGDGTPDVVAVYRRVPDPPTNASGASNEIEVLAFNGRDGRPRWAPHRIQEPGLSFDPPPSPLLVNLDGDGRRTIAVCFAGQGVGLQTVLLDAEGHPRPAQSHPPGSLTAAMRLWANDLDGDGKDELVFVQQSWNEAKVRATRGGVERSIWEWSLPGQAEIVDVQPAAQGRGPSIVVAALANTVYGLDGATGKPAWHGQGLPSDPVRTSNGSALFNSDVLATDDPAGLPRITGRWQQSTVCRLTEPTRPTEKPRAVWSPLARPLSDDPRLFRMLPWTAGREQLRELVLTMSMSAGIALLLVILPALLLVRMVQRRRWSVARLIVLTVVLGLLFAFVRFSIPVLAPSLRDLLMRAVVGLPTMSLLALAIVWLARGRWWRLGLLLAGSLLLGVVFALISLKFDAPRMGPTQKYSWDGWYLIGFAGAYAAGAVSVVMLVLRGPALLVLRRLRPLVRRTSPA